MKIFPLSPKTKLLIKTAILMIKPTDRQIVAVKISSTLEKAGLQMSASKIDTVLTFSLMGITAMLD